MDLTDAVREVLLVAPRNFGIGHLSRLVLQMVEKYATGRDLSEEDKRNAFMNLLPQVLKEAEEQGIISFAMYTELVAFIARFGDQVADIREALNTQNARAPLPEVERRCLPCKRKA